MEEKSVRGPWAPGYEQGKVIAHGTSLLLNTLMLSAIYEFPMPEPSRDGAFKESSADKLFLIRERNPFKIASCQLRGEGR